MSDVCRAFAMVTRQGADEATRKAMTGAAVLGGSLGYTVELRDGSQIEIGRACCKYCARVEAYHKVSSRLSEGRPLDDYAKYKEGSNHGKSKQPARQFVLGRKAYGKMYALAVWTRAIPDWIELGDYAWEQIECHWQEVLQPQLAPEEIVRVQMEGAALVAYVWPYEQGHKETRVPILEGRRNRGKK